MEHTEEQESQEETTKIAETSQKTKKMNVSVLLYGAFGACVIALVVLYGVVYMQTKKLSENTFIVQAARVFQRGAVKVDGKTYLYSDYIKDLHSVRKIYTNPNLGLVGLTEKDYSNLAVGNFFSSVKTEELAKKYNVKVTPEEVKAEEKKVIDQYGEAAVKTGLEQNFGFDLPTFMERVVTPVLLSNKVRAEFEKSTDPEGAVYKREEVSLHHILVKVDDMTNVKEKATKKQKAEVVLRRLQRGENFEAVAKEVSDDPQTKELGGKMDWVPRGALIQEIDSVAFTLQTKKLSGLIESPFGYHIIWVDEKRTVRDFDSFLDAEVHKMQPKFLVPLSNPLENKVNSNPAQAEPTLQ